MLHIKENESTTEKAKKSIKIGRLAAPGVWFPTTNPGLTDREAIILKNLYLLFMESVLRFKKYLPYHLDAFKELVKENRTMRYITGDGLGLTGERAEIKFRSILAVNRDHPLLGYFQVSDVTTGQVVGECKLVYLNGNKDVFEIGYLIKPQFWRQGIGIKICTYLLALASDLNANADVIGVIDPDNSASRKLLIKFGFQSYYRGREDDKPTEKLILRRH